MKKRIRHRFKVIYRPKPGQKHSWMIWDSNDLNPTSVIGVDTRIEGRAMAAKFEKRPMSFYNELIRLDKKRKKKAA